VGEEKLTHRLHLANRKGLVWLRPASLFLTVAAALVLALLLGSPTALRAQGTPAASSTAATHESAAHAVAPAKSALGSPVKSYGSPSAPVKLEVFTDYQCPSCRTFFEQTLRPLINDYVASGKVYVLHHDYPLSGHQYSGMAARWANAAARVGQFGNVEGALYDNQMMWEMTGDLKKYVSASMPAADFKRVEQQMEGCDGPGPTAAPSGGVAYPPGGHACPLDAFITPDIALGMKVPVQATPTYRITYKGQVLPAASGAVSWAILRQFFDSLLAQ